MSTSENLANRGTKKNYQNFKAKGQRNFVEQLPFWHRYRRACIFGGGFLTFCIVYSAPIYYFFRTPREHEDPRLTMWPGEIAKGKTYAQQFREKIEKQRKMEAEMAEAKAAKAANNKA